MIGWDSPPQCPHPIHITVRLSPEERMLLDVLSHCEALEVAVEPPAGSERVVALMEEARAHPSWAFYIAQP